ncbi:MAG: exodeoxyribonuclease VII large subunit [Bacilli bacterium]
MPDKYITVTQLTKYIKFQFDTDNNLNSIFLRGEISNFKAHTRGHYYFTIKDENSRINAVMFASSASKLLFTPVDGMKVLITGKVSVYEVTGGYQIYVNDMIEDGLGNLFVAYEQLKAKLSKEGLFDIARKKAIPKYPEVVGIITAPTGAAIRDILSTIKRRFPLTKTILFPCLVQGASAAPDIIKQIKNAENYNLDVLIIGRGGGSIEDMWGFNDEQVALAIANCSIPIISAVGHEIDFTIADFVADLRAPTPTGAAEMAVANKVEVLDYIKQLKLRLVKIIEHKITTSTSKLTSLTDSYIMKNQISLLDIKEQKLDTLLDRVILALNHILEQAKIRLTKTKESYILVNPTQLYLTKQNRFKTSLVFLNNNISRVLEQNEKRYIKSLSKLEPLNPLLTIKRGYAILKKDNKVVSMKSNLKKDDILEIELQDGIIKTKVMESE